MQHEPDAAGGFAVDLDRQARRRRSPVGERDEPFGVLERVGRREAVAHVCGDLGVVGVSGERVPV